MTLFSSLVAFAITLALLWPLRQLALRFGILDDPGPRKIHKDPVPYLGGLAMLGGLSTAVLWLRPEWWTVVVMLASITAIGLGEARRRSHGRMRCSGPRFLMAPE